MPQRPYQVPLFPQHALRCSGTVRHSSVSTWVDGLSTPVDRSRGMAPSAYLRIAGQVVVAPISRILRRRI